MQRVKDLPSGRDADMVMALVGESTQKGCYREEMSDGT